MTALSSYLTGTATVSAGGTTVTGTSTIWSGTNVKPGDIFQIGNFQSVITDVTDTTHLVIPPWGGGAQTGVAYKIWQVSPQRFAGAQAMGTVSQLVAALSVSGFFWFVAVGLTAPDPSYGNDGQWAYQPSTGAYWLKTGGVWVASGSPAAGYGGTSTTSRTIGAGLQAFTTQAGLAYNGARVRAAAASDVTKWMEGVATYSGTTLTITVDKSNGSGTFASWVFAVAGQPATGDMQSANNLSDVANVATALNNLNGVSYGATQSLTSTQKAKAKSNTFKGVTTQVFTSGSGTYTTPADVSWIEIELIGGGGGGAGSGTSPGNGGSGGATTWGTGPILSSGVATGATGASGGGGGTPSGGFFNKAGANGGNGSGLASTTGGFGANSPYGGAGVGGAAGAGAGVAAAANTGSGGGGGGVNATVNGGGGGAAGGFLRAIINAPAATYLYAVGAGGSAGTTGTSGAAGGAGGSGFIQVVEHYD